MINIINQILKEQYLNNILKRGKDYGFYEN